MGGWGISAGPCETLACAWRVRNSLPEDQGSMCPTQAPGTQSGMAEPLCWAPSFPRQRWSPVGRGDSKTLEFSPSSKTPDASESPQIPQTSFQGHETGFYFVHSLASAKKRMTLDEAGDPHLNKFNFPLSFSKGKKTSLQIT